MPFISFPTCFPFLRSLQLQRRQRLSRASKCPPAPFRPRRQESKARESPRSPEPDAVGEAPALPSAGLQLEQRLCLPRRTWPPGSPVPQAYSSRHALGRSFLLSNPAGTPSPGRALPLRRPHGSVPAWLHPRGCPGRGLGPGAPVEQEGGGGERARSAERGGAGGWQKVRPSPTGEGWETDRRTRRTGGELLREWRKEKSW